MKEKLSQEFTKENLEENEAEQLTEQQLADLGLSRESKTPEEIALTKDAIKKGFEALSPRGKKDFRKLLFKRYVFR
ncbi:MAG: hypothetical protein KGZ30_01000 [Anaplasmataceae bacterium]|nr:hypothetical protein [Anaplasmataceae bacterium]